MTTSARDVVTFRERAGLPVLEWTAFDRLGVDAVVTTRAGGVSVGPYASLNLGLHVGDDPAAVVTNRQRAAHALGTSLDRFVFCQQTHEPNVAVVTAQDAGAGARDEAGALAATDALVTRTPGIVLVVMVADCVPLVLLDPAAGVLAAVHAGWKGTIRGVTTRAVQVMTELGAAVERIEAGIGPSIHPDRYQVGPEVRALAAQVWPDTVDEVIRPEETGGRWTFDLWRANSLQLTSAGVRPGNVHLAGVGTGPGTPFFSHRLQGPCGRFAAVARLHPA